MLKTAEEKSRIRIRVHKSVVRIRTKMSQIYNTVASVPLLIKMKISKREHF
jgi:hypothetical protein